MSKPLHLLFLAALICLGSSACEQKKTAAQIHAEREKVWQTERRQRAVKYYQDLIQKYPDSPYANQARERLTAMGAPLQAAAGGGQKPGASKP